MLAGVGAAVTVVGTAFGPGADDVAGAEGDAVVGTAVGPGVGAGGWAGVGAAGGLLEVPVIWT